MHHQPTLRPSPIALLTEAPKATNRSTTDADHAFRHEPKLQLAPAA
jgi:hypothetical protein